MAVLAGAALALLALSLVSYEEIRPRLDAASVDGDAGVDADRWGLIVVALRTTAVVLGLAALLVGAAGRRIDGTLGVAVVELASAVRGWIRCAWVTLRHEQPAHLLALVVLVGLALAVRVAELDVPMRYDEAATYANFVSAPPYVAIANYAEPNNHVFHTLLAQASTGILVMRRGRCDSLRCSPGCSASSPSTSSPDGSTAVTPLSSPLRWAQPPRRRSSTRPTLVATRS